MGRGPADLESDLAGLDALQSAVQTGAGTLRRAWSRLWPPLVALLLSAAIWQLVVLSDWRPGYALPGPRAVLGRLVEDLASGEILSAAGVTLRRALSGYGMALVIGGLIGLAVSQSKLLRRAVGSLITGLQTMPSIAWFPLALLLFGLSEGAILFVVVMGAGPSVANGLITGVDHVQPVLLRAGKVLGARGLSSYRHVVLPAALPSFVGGLKQAWAFSWRSLMAAELLASIGTSQSIGVRLQFAIAEFDAEAILSTMLVILAIGILVDLLVFGTLTKRIRRRYGLVDGA